MLLTVCHYGDQIKQGEKGRGHAVAQLVEALRYKMEGRGLDSCWGKPWCRLSLLTEVSTRNIS